MTELDGIGILLVILVMRWMLRQCAIKQKEIDDAAEEQYESHR